jgi:hypothetical protein
MRTQKRKSKVASGQTYRVARRGRQARHVQIFMVKGLTGNQAWAYYKEITRTGNPIRGTGNRHAMQWNGTDWAMSPGFELVTL